MQLSGFRFVLAVVAIMGTTLHGIVERWCEPNQGMRGHWEAVARIEFNKDYELMSALDDVAESGWPVDADRWGFGDCYFCKRSPDDFDGKQWLHAGVFERVVARVQEASPQALGVLDFAKRFREARLLFFRF